MALAVSVVFIDPGKHSCACALMRRRSLTALEATNVCPEWAAVTDVVLELPEANGRSTPPDDLIAITATGCLIAGRLAGRNGCVRLVTPRQWKGSVPKPVHHHRMWDALTPAERALLGGPRTLAAIVAASLRGAGDRWQKKGAAYYRKAELPAGITHDLLDAAAGGLYAVGRKF
jgi:hypothetical protein